MPSVNSKTSESPCGGTGTAAPVRLEWIDPLTDDRWDRFVDDHPYGWLCHRAAWKQVLESAFPHMRGYYPVLQDAASGDLLAALPLYHVSSRLTGSRLVSIPFASLCDPLIQNDDQWQQLWPAVLELQRRCRTGHVEIRTHACRQGEKDERIGRRCFFLHHCLGLDRPAAELKASFHRTCVRQRIDRAEKSGLTLQIGRLESDLKTFYDLYVLTRKRKALPPQPYAFLEALWRAFEPTGNLELLLAEYRGSFPAGMILLKYKDRVSAEFAVSDDNFRHISPNHFLFWRAIQAASSEGYRRFDFGRTSPRQESLLDFKRRWGTEQEDLPELYHPAEACPNDDQGESDWKYRMVQGLSRRIPLCWQGRWGRFIYRHLG
ncbi:MAG: GNAT family N-acetyltransferase [Sedimentisphaerales bacterium]|nr:GNAT family N-acetyltransferase [Sedimentisphaerales bacterium]